MRDASGSTFLDTLPPWNKSVHISWVPQWVKKALETGGVGRPHLDSTKKTKCALLPMVCHVTGAADRAWGGWGDPWRSRRSLRQAARGLVLPHISQGVLSKSLGLYEVPVPNVKMEVSGPVHPTGSTW